MGFCWPEAAAAAPPFTGSFSTSIDFLSLRPDSSEKRLLRTSGGRLRGCSSGSIFLRRKDDEEMGSVACRAEERKGLEDEEDEEGGFDSRVGGDVDRCDFLVGDRDEDVLGVGAFVGEGGCCCCCCCCCCCWDSWMTVS